MLCATFKIPSSVIDGLNDSDNKYIGLANLKSSLESFETESNLMVSNVNELNSI